MKCKPMIILGVHFPCLEVWSNHWSSSNLNFQDIKLSFKYNFSIIVNIVLYQTYTASHENIYIKVSHRLKIRLNI